MANTLKIKRNTWNNSTTPTGLAYGELAWDNAGETLYIGKQTDGGGTIASTKISTTATTSVKGLASFSSGNFAVSNGAVTIKDDGVDSAQIADNAIVAALVANNSVALGTKTTGDYVSTITGGTGIDSNGATSGEGVAHSLTLDLNELGTETTIAQADFIAMVDATDSGSQKITFSNLEDQIFGNVSGDIAIAAGGTASIAAGSIVTADIANDQVIAAGSVFNTARSSSNTNT